MVLRNISIHYNKGWIFINDENSLTLFMIDLMDSVLYYHISIDSDLIICIKETGLHFDMFPFDKAIEMNDIKEFYEIDRIHFRKNDIVLYDTDKIKSIIDPNKKRISLSSKYTFYYWYELVKYLEDIPEFKSYKIRNYVI